MFNKNGNFCSEPHITNILLSIGTATNLAATIKINLVEDSNLHKNVGVRWI